MIQHCFPMLPPGRPYAFPMIGGPMRVRASSVDRIQRVVAEFYGLSQSCMVSARRSRLIAHPRQVAMFLAKELTPQSLPAIGRRFGGRDHTTVIHAIKAVGLRMAVDADLADDVDTLRAKLG